MLMQAVVIQVQWESLLVLDLDTQQRVIVNTPVAHLFRPGDQVNIWYNGVMTRSIPPQIYAQSIRRAPSNEFPPVPCLPGQCPPQFRPPIVFPPIFRPPWRPGPRR